jgi:acetolactate decarboxylase
MRDQSEKEHNHDLHKKSKVHFTEKSVSGTLLGFYSTQHEGVFTHKGQYIHVHFVNENKRATGHLDGIIVKKAVIQLGE